MERFQALVIKRENLKKEIFSLRQEILFVLGDLQLELYRTKVEIIRLKKEISWIIQRRNSGSVIDPEEMQTEIEKQMTEYRNQISQLTEAVSNVKNRKEIPAEEVREIRLLYRKLVRKIHPDLHPELAGHPEFSDLWEQIQSAYLANSRELLEELSVLVLKLSGDEADLPQLDLEEKIDRIQDEIDLLERNPVFESRKWLSSEEGIRKEKDVLENELKEQESYRNQLSREKEALIQEANACPMN